MRTDKKIDYSASSVTNDEVLIRLLCSPLYYDEVTGQVSIDAFDLRMMGQKGNQPEHFASIGRDSNFVDNTERLHYLQAGYSVWDGKEWNPNSYLFFAGQVKAISKRIELWPLKQSAAYHIGLFYAASEDTFFKEPLPKDNPEILLMLSELAELIEDNIHKAPPRPTTPT